MIRNQKTSTPVDKSVEWGFKITAMSSVIFNGEPRNARAPATPPPEIRVVRSGTIGSCENSDSLLTYDGVRLIIDTQRHADDIEVGRLLQNASNAINAVADKSTRHRAERLAVRLDQELRLLGLHETAHFEGTAAEDGSFLLEWTTLEPRQRLGFNVEANEDDSGWYFVSLNGARASSASGSLANIDLAMALGLMTKPRFHLPV